MEAATAPTAVQSPLVDHSANAHLSHAPEAPAVGQDLKAATMQSMEYHRQCLKEKIEGGEQARGHYISPSDGIMSPATKKLSNIKGKRYQNAGKGQNLFAKALGKKAFESKMSAASDSTPAAEKTE